MAEEDKSHQMLVFWMDVNRAVAGAKRKRKLAMTAQLVPWTCEDTEVKRAWEKLTAPENLDALEQWLEGVSRKKSKSWTKKAITECKRRLRQNRKSR